MKETVSRYIFLSDDIQYLTTHVDITITLTFLRSMINPVLPPPGMSHNTFNESAVPIQGVLIALPMKQHGLTSFQLIESSTHTSHSTSAQVRLSNLTSHCPY